MSKPKSDDDILELFDKINADVKRHGRGTKRAVAAAPRFNAVQNEWSELDMAAVFSAEIEERKQWFVTGLVLLRQRQLCVCGSTHENTWGVYTREQHRNGATKLRKPRPDDYTSGEMLTRREEWLEDEQVHDCPTCFMWGERHLQHDFPFEGNGTLRMAPADLLGITQRLVDTMAYHATTDAPKHNYFETGGNDEHSTEDTLAEPTEDTSEQGQPEDVFAFIERATRSNG